MHRFKAILTAWDNKSISFISIYIWLKLSFRMHLWAAQKIPTKFWEAEISTYQCCFWQRLTFMCAFLELPMSILVKMNLENTYMVHTQKSSIPVWSETLCVSPHLSVQPCYHPSYHAHSLTPCHSLPETPSVGSAAEGRLGLLLLSCPAHPSLLLGLDTSGHFCVTSSLSWRKCMGEIGSRTYWWS